MSSDTINRKMIKDAAKKIANCIHNTPILTSRIIDEIAGCNLFFKCENFQKTGAFKARGALNAVLSASQEALSNGVATHSSGNHAAALSYAASLKKIKAYIVMPSNSKKSKIEAVKNYGGEIIFCEPTLEAREIALAEVVQQTSAFFVHPYNNSKVIAGQATAAKELLHSCIDLDYIIAPVGGGGLLSGTALSALFFAMNTKVIAAEPSGADDAIRSIKKGKILPSVQPDTICDGLLTSLGSLTFPIIRSHVESIIVVEDKEIIEAMQLIWTRLKILVEPSSAIVLAAVLQNEKFFNKKKVGLIISGGNVDLGQLPW